jgi:L-rhamnose mutarotase
MKTRATKIILFLSSVGLFAGCATRKPPQRVACTSSLKPDKAARCDYEYLQGHIWPGVNKIIKGYGIQNFSLHKCAIDRQPYLFAYLEYTDANFDADGARVAADPETQRWWNETDPCQSPLQGAAANGKIWSDTKEVCFLS